tara:strand:- start:2929 stop:4236 length:1308 start_codon:yes stop_codon:yes gene_type:complete
MTEIIKIILIFPIFLLFLSSPINLFNNNKTKINFENLNYNLLLNCNILLVLSFFSISIKSYQMILISIYILIFIYSFISSKLKLKDLIKINYLGLLILFFSFIILSMVISSNLSLGWDAKYFYYIKSLFFFEGLDIKELNKFEHNKWHPHFGSYLWAFFWSIPFFEIEYFGRLFYLFIFCFSIFFISLSSNNKSIIFPLILYLVLLIILFNYDRFSGLQEVLIFSLLLISSKILYELNLKKNILNIFFLLLIINLFVWIKSEGIAYASIIITILLLNKNIFLKEKIYFSIGVILIFILKYLIYYNFDFQVNAQPYSLEQIILINFDNFIYRFEKIIIYLSYYSLKNPLFVLGILLLIYLNFEKSNKILLNNFNLFFILNILFIFVAYLFRDLEILYSLKTTLERIVFTSSGFYIYLIKLYIYKLVETKKRKWKLF